MNNRERNKEYNRSKILAAARLLLQEGGLEALSMRTLATRAQVSSRTPYNLFGSKTDVLVALLDEPLKRLIAEIPPPAPGKIIVGAFALIDSAHAMYAADIEYYREIYWGVMSSEHHQAREKYLRRTEQWIPRLLGMALKSRELKASTDIDALASHLTFTIIGLLGLWASALMTDSELVKELKKTLVYCFHYHAGRSVQKALSDLIVQ